MVRKAVALILIALVLFFTGLTILAIWDIVDIEGVLTKSLKTVLVIFISAGMLLFIFSIIYKSDQEGGNQPLNQPPGGVK